jgi:hypothetical protein
LFFTVACSDGGADSAGIAASCLRGSGVPCRRQQIARSKIRTLKIEYKEVSTMPYAILRFQKKKSGGVTACYTHNERKKEAYKSNPDINPRMKTDNYHLVLPKQTYRREVQRMIRAAGCKTRSNSTVMVETLITASPEFMNALPPPIQREYFERALRFISSKVGGENIIAAVVHMDEKTPHMHLSFCPITVDKIGKSLSAKAILGNQAQLSRWQTDYHDYMASRWPELERGLSSIETKRRHIPQSLFKQAERLDRQIGEIESALAGIGPFNAGKQREKALAVLHDWLPRAQYFTAKVKKVDGYIAELEKREAETQERIRLAEERGERSADYALAQMQNKLGEIGRLLREEHERTDKLRRQCYHQETLIGKIPFELRDNLISQMKEQRERGKSR